MTEPTALESGAIRWAMFRARDHLQTFTLGVLVQALIGGVVLTLWLPAWASILIALGVAIVLACSFALLMALREQRDDLRHRVRALLRARAEATASPEAQAQHTAPVTRWAGDQRVILRPPLSTDEVVTSRHIDMNDRLATVFAEHFQQVGDLVNEWNKALVRYDTARQQLSTKTAAATAAVGFVEVGHQWPIYYAATQYAVGQPADVDNLDFRWEGDALVNPLTDDSIRLDRPRPDAEKLALPGLLKDRCMETERWDETRALRMAWDEVGTLRQQLDSALDGVAILPELPETCSIHPGSAGPLHES